MLSSSNPVSNSELMDESKKILDPSIYDYISGGAGTEWGVANNVNAFQRYQIVPRVLQETGVIDTSTEMFGKKIAYPIIIGPCAFHKLVCEKGEMATAAAASQSNTIFTLSTMSTCTIEEVAASSSQEKWFQLYIFKDKKITTELIRRAEDAGYSALVVTVDVPAMGMRSRDIRNKFSLPNDIEAVNFKKFGLSAISKKTDGSKIKQHTDQQFDADLGWDSIDWLKTITKLPIVLKGLLNSQDASESIKHGVSAIVVSNHGGRQIDSVISTMDALPEIAKVVNHKIPLIVDGGVRNGEDVFKAIALGATAVMIARPVMWALSVGGEKAVINMLSQLQNEFSLTMRLSGCPNVRSITDQGLSLLSGSNITEIKLRELIRNLEERQESEDIHTITPSRFFMNGSQ